MKSEVEIRQAISLLSLSHAIVTDVPVNQAHLKGEIRALQWVLDEEPPGVNVDWMLSLTRQVISGDYENAKRAIAELSR